MNSTIEIPPQLITFMNRARTGTKLSIFSSNMMGMSVCQQAVIVSVLPHPELKLHYQSGPVSGLRIGTFKEPGKRKVYHLTIPYNHEHSLVFEGFDIPFCTDGDAKRPGSTGFIGDANINLAGEADVIRDWVENRSILPASDDTKSRIMVAPPSGQPFDITTGAYTPLYPELHERYGR